jgi:Putative transposase/Transposase zinc-binding domain
MVAIADIFRIHGPEYRAKFGGRMLPRHRRAMQDMERCRTETLGGQVYHCESCGAYHDSDHSCKNRHCPQCQQDQAEPWLDHQTRLRRPVSHFMVTFTLPDALRELARRHQKTLANIRFRSSSEALQELALDPRCIGGRIGMVGVLHTWTRDLRSHPHVHDIVPGGGLTADDRWLPSRPDFLVHVKPLSGLFRAKFRDALHQTDLFPLVDAQVWNKDGVVHGEPVGRGAEAFRYLAPYSFRVAISNHRILTLQEGRVTLPYKASATNQGKTCTLPAEECMRRFLPHVLPARCIKVRDAGWLSPTNRHVLTRARALLGAGTVDADTTGHHRHPIDPTDARALPRCPTCGSTLRLVQTRRPQGRAPPY